MRNLPSPARQNALKNKMAATGIYDKDIEEKFIRARGRGGQKINKTSVSVYLRHRPSGIEVKCQQTRSQAMNRLLARERLVSKIRAAEQARLSEEKKRIAKIKRQKRRPSRRARKKMLEQKRRRSEKKKSRSWRPRSSDFA